MNLDRRCFIVHIIGIHGEDFESGKVNGHNHQVIVDPDTGILQYIRCNILASHCHGIACIHQSGTNIQNQQCLYQIHSRKTLGNLNDLREKFQYFK